MTKRLTKKQIKAIVDELYADAIFSTPVTVDNWQDLLRGDGGDNPAEFWEAAKCDKCGKAGVFCNGGGGEYHKEILYAFPDDVEETDDKGAVRSERCDGYVTTADGPMMNYFYPVECPNEMEAALKIVDLPLCIVRVNGQSGLALTGGGMDLSWEICRAFIALGHLPPLHFCDLPAMAGRIIDKDLVIAACETSVRVAKQRLSFRQKELRALRRALAERR